MQRTMGRRAFRRTVSQAGIGRVRPTLAYKCPAMGGALVVADRWFGRPSRIMAAVATGLTESSATGSGVAPGVGSWWTAMPTRR